MSSSERDTTSNADSNEKSLDEEGIGLLVHSYNNFLAGMMGFTELSLLETEQDDVKERLELVLSSGKEAVVFGKQLLSMISRLQSVFTDVDLNKIINEISAAHQIEMDYQIPNQSMVVESDAQWLWYCFESLCQFCKAYNREARLSISVTHQGAYQDKKLLKLCFVSEGLMFAKQEQETLFTPFYTSRHLLGKKDVGLAFVKGFIEQMKGEMSWNEEEGFVVVLPLKK
ncbi:MAG: hypothetical protein OQK51_21545 [Kangiellaceae bacterium]|nr:hypothetical protein [Kangiellaceae bacterium]